MVSIPATSQHMFMVRPGLLGRVLLVAILVGLVILSLGMLTSAQALSASVESESGVQVDQDLDGTVDGATSDVDRLKGDVDSRLQLSLDGETADALGGLGLDGLVPRDAGGDPSAGLSTDRSDVKARPLTTQETTVVGGMAVAAGAGFLFWLQSIMGFGGARFLGAPLFSRIEKDALLDNEGREMIMTLVEANPGIGLKELSEQSGLGWGTTVYHASRLEQAGFVASMKKGQNRHFFKNGHPAARMKESVAVLRNETAGSLARFLLETPGATQTTIARNLGLGAPTVTKYVKRMEQQGLVEVLALGRSKVVQPTSELQVALAHAMPEAVAPRIPSVPFAGLPMPRVVAASA